MTQSRAIEESVSAETEWTREHQHGSTTTRQIDPLVDWRAQLAKHAFARMPRSLLLAVGDRLHRELVNEMLHSVPAFATLSPGVHDLKSVRLEGIWRVQRGKNHDR